MAARSMEVGALDAVWGSTDLIRTFEQKYPEQVERANAEMKRRRGGRPPAPKASASTPACGGSAASASAASGPSLRLCSAVRWRPLASINP